MPHLPRRCNRDTGVPSERRTGLRPDMTSLITPGISLLKLRSPPPKRFPAPNHTDIRRPRGRVSLGDQIRAALADIVRASAVKREVLPVRQLQARAISLVGGGDDNLNIFSAETDTLEDDPCPGDVCLEGGHRTQVGDRHNGLSCQMEDGLHLVFGKNAVNESRVHSDVARADRHAIAQVFDLDKSARNRVAHDGHDVCTTIHEPADYPTAQQSRCAGDKDPCLCPRGVYSHSRHCAAPSSQSDRKALTSFSVSIGCQKSVCVIAMTSPSAAKGELRRSSMLWSSDSIRSRTSRRSTIKPPFTQPSPTSGFSTNSVTAAAFELEPTEPCRRPHRHQGCEATMIAMKFDGLAQFALVRQSPYERQKLSSGKCSASLRTRPPVLVA